MTTTPVSELIPVLQTAIGPVILISGVGLLLLSMTNRLGRIVDRSRNLARDLREGAPDAKVRADAQVRILTLRASYVRRAIAFATLSVLFAALLIIVLFLTALLHLDDAALIATLFILCMASLIASLVGFLRDINLSLAALRNELGTAAGGNLGG
jgi:hypothetical protein